MWTSIYLGLGSLVAAGILWNVLWGRDRRLFRSREFCYKELDIPEMDDATFGKHPSFNGTNVPSEYAIAKRMEIADSYLDFPVRKLHPDMIWDQIPIDPSPWQRNVDGFQEYLQSLGELPSQVLKGKTVAEIIIKLWKIESRVIWSDISTELPAWWKEQSILKERVKARAIQHDEIAKKTIADVVKELHRIHESLESDS